MRGLSPYVEESVEPPHRCCGCQKVEPVVVSSSTTDPWKLVYESSAQAPELQVVQATPYSVSHTRIRTEATTMTDRFVRLIGIEDENPADANPAE